MPLRLFQSLSISPSVALSLSLCLSLNLAPYPSFPLSLSISLSVGVPEEAGSQAWPGLLSAETHPTSHKVPAAAQGSVELLPLHGYIQHVLAERTQESWLGTLDRC